MPIGTAGQRSCSSNTNGVPNANYSSSSGGNGSTTGQFTGSGANRPQPLANAPPLDPSGGVATHR